MLKFPEVSEKDKERVSNKLPIPEYCPYCDGDVVVAHHTEVYKKSYGKWPWLYLCTQCKAYVGMHPNTDIPLGYLADEETRKARNSCKPYFEKIWKGGYMSRSRAYSWLAESMRIPHRECHFGWFNVEDCEKAKKICKDYLSK